MMINLKKILEQLLLMSILGGVSMGVKYIARMSENLEHMTVAIQLLTEKLTTIDKVSQDHEARLRMLEFRQRR